MDSMQMASKLSKVRSWGLQHVRISELHKMAVDLASMSQTDVDRIKIDLEIPDRLSLWEWVACGASVRSADGVSTQSA